jgi:hypothetical protein
VTVRSTPANQRRLDHTFLDDLMRQLEGYEQHALDPVLRRGTHRHSDALPYQYPHYKRLLQREDVKRILFDARQAGTFVELDQSPGSRISRQLHLPFDAFYLEFSEPVALSPDSWQVQDGEYLRAFIIGGSQRIEVWRPADESGGSGTYSMVKPIHVAAFITDWTTTSFTDRLWRFDLGTGETYVQRATCDDLGERRFSTDNVDGVEARVIDPGQDVSTGLEALKKEDFFPAGWGADSRTVGWWERATLAGTSLIQWCLAYMMAKGIVIEVEQSYMSRQQRRWRDRRGIPYPKPWHVLKVDPRHQRARQPGDESAPGTSHGYRYDVMGTIRLNRHRVGQRRDDGTYEMRDVREWVSPHQRGLAHAHYIPATRAVLAGRRVPSELRDHE